MAGDNVWGSPTGRRLCRECYRIRQAEKNAKPYEPWSEVHPEETLAFKRALKQAKAQQRLEQRLLTRESAKERAKERARVRARNRWRVLHPPKPKEVRTHCKQGHPFDERNTYWAKSKNGKRWITCRECHRLWYHKNKERLQAQGQSAKVA